MQINSIINCIIEHNLNMIKIIISTTPFLYTVNMSYFEDTGCESVYE